MSLFDAIKDEINRTKRSDFVDRLTGKPTNEEEKLREEQEKRRKQAKKDAKDRRVSAARDRAIEGNKRTRRSRGMSLLTGQQMGYPLL